MAGGIKAFYASTSYLMNTEELKEKILAVAPGKRITCSVACRIAEEANVSPKEIGRLLDELDIKIMQCRLGCF